MDGGDHVVVEVHHALLNYKQSKLNKKPNDIGGCILAAIVFLLHHNPALCEYFNIKRLNDLPEWPLVKPWSKVIYNSLKNPYRPSKLLSDDDVTNFEFEFDDSRMSTCLGITIVTILRGRVCFQC